MNFCRILIAALLAFAAGCAMAAPTREPLPFRVGVAPHSSARVILQMYQPLRAHLEKTLARPVEIVTASDFTEFARRAVKQEYDLAITTGHQARLLESDARYLPLLTYKADFTAVVVVEADSPYREPKQLAGQTIVGLSPSSLVTIWGEHWAQRNGIGDVRFRYVSASDSAVHLLFNGEGAAGLISRPNYQNLRPEIRQRVRILDESLPMAGRVYVLNGRHAAIKEKLFAALWEFAETPAAQQYFESYKLGGYRRLEPRELFGMEPYANEVRKVLKAGK